MIEIQECDTTYDNIGRIYKTPLGSYYSVTTMLSNSSEKEFLQDWKERIGEEEAAKQTRVASHLGTNFHELGEAYLLKQPMPKVQWKAKYLFDRAIPILKEHVTKVHAVEIPLWSEILQLAGRTDAVLDWDNELCVFDFKCIGHHNEKWLTDYWIQTEAYGVCLKEMYGVDIKKLVLLCANKKTLKVKAFTIKPKKHYIDLRDRIIKFRKFLRT